MSETFRENYYNQIVPSVNEGAAKLSGLLSPFCLEILIPNLDRRSSDHHKRPAFREGLAEIKRHGRDEYAIAQVSSRIDDLIGAGMVFPSYAVS